MSLAEALLNGSGYFQLVQIILIALILILFILKVIGYYRKKGPQKLPFHKSHHAILFLGIFACVWGFFEQLVGLIQALNAIIEAADVSPQLVLGGLRQSFISPAIGVGTLLVAAILWAILHGRYTASMKRD